MSSISTSWRRPRNIRMACRIGISIAYLPWIKPILFNFHGYPWLIHRLAYRRNNHHNLHVRGYKEKGSINTPLELAIQNEIDRFSLVIDAIIDCRLCGSPAPTSRKKCANMQIDCRNYAMNTGPICRKWTHEPGRAKSRPVKAKAGSPAWTWGTGKGPRMPVLKSRVGRSLI